MFGAGPPDVKSPISIPLNDARVHGQKGVKNGKTKSDKGERLYGDLTEKDRRLFGTGIVIEKSIHKGCLK